MFYAEVSAVNTDGSAVEGMQRFIFVTGVFVLFFSARTKK
jgi:hypothetical protein